MDPNFNSEQRAVVNLIRFWCLPLGQLLVLVACLLTLLVQKLDEISAFF